MPRKSEVKEKLKWGVNNLKIVQKYKEYSPGLDNENKMKHRVNIWDNLMHVHRLRIWSYCLLIR